MPLLSVNNLCYDWSEDARLGPISFEFDRNEVIGVFGRSGTGKTTLFRVLSGEISPKSGAIEYTGKQKRVYHDQLQKVVPWFSAKANMIISLSPEQREARRSDIQLIIDSAGIGEFEDRDASRLSGGQRARVALARTLLEDSDLVLLDEPFTGVDAISQEVIVQELPKFLHNKLTFITAHDPGVLALLSTKILCLKPSNGTVHARLHEFKSEKFLNLPAADRRRSSEYLAEVQGLMEALYE